MSDRRMEEIKRVSAMLGRAAMNGQTEGEYGTKALETRLGDIMGDKPLPLSGDFDANMLQTLKLLDVPPAPCPLEAILDASKKPAGNYPENGTGEEVIAAACDEITCKFCGKHVGYFDLDDPYVSAWFVCLDCHARAEKDPKAPFKAEAETT